MKMLHRKTLFTILTWTATCYVISGQSLRHHQTQLERHDESRQMAPEDTDEVHQTGRSMNEWSDYNANFTVSGPFPDNPQNDLGIRFSKVTFADDVDQRFDALLPLGKDDYPLDPATVEWLKYSQCPSIVIPETCLDCQSFESMIASIGGHPSHPSKDPKNPYWQELLEVVSVRDVRKLGIAPKSIMPLPKLWKDFSIDEVAEAVHDEYPGYHQSNLIASLLENGATVDERIVPKRCRAEFLNGIVMLANLNTWAIGAVGPPNFGLKYFVGRARPEEIAYQISQGILTADDGVPQELLNAIPLRSLESQESFTAYPEGCPMHPAWPAMHSAASSSSMWLPVVLNLTPQQWCQAKLMDFGVAYARTVAGVHYASDNIAGLDLGQQLVANALPEYLAEHYGSDPGAVRQKIEEFRFDWKDFLSSDCVV